MLGQQVVVENVGGAGGMLGSSRVVKSAPDGYTMVIGTTADAINQTLYKALQFCDRPGAGRVDGQPANRPARTQGLSRQHAPGIRQLRQSKPGLGTVRFGQGSTGHLFCELLNAALGIKNVTHVPYRGGGPAMQDLIAGRYDYICTLSPTGKPLIDANSVKGIAILQPKRSPRS